MEPNWTYMDRFILLETLFILNKTIFLINSSKITQKV